jgi:hypothetical protein
MRFFSVLPLLLPLALPAQTIVSQLGGNNWDAYSAFINASSTSFDFHDMAGTANGALTVTTNGVANIASYDIGGTNLSAFSGATYRWEPGTRNVSLRLELNRTTTLFGFSFSSWAGTLVYNPVSTSTGWNTTTVDSSSLWSYTSYKGTTNKYRTLGDWISYFGSSYATINAIELGVGTSTPTGTYTGSIDSVEYSILSGGTLITEKTDFATPIPEPSTAAALIGTCCLGAAAIAHRRKRQRLR